MILSVVDLFLPTGVTSSKAMAQGLHLRHSNRGPTSGSRTTFRSRKRLILRIGQDSLSWGYVSALGRGGHGGATGDLWSQAPTLTVEVAVPRG